MFLVWVLSRLFGGKPKTLNLNLKASLDRPRQDGGTVSRVTQPASDFSPRVFGILHLLELGFIYPIYLAHKSAKVHVP